MSVRKRGGVYHMDIVVRHGKKVLRVKKTTGTKNKHEAVAAEAKERAKLLAKAFVAGKAPFFCDFGDEFVDSYAVANNKPSEVDSKRKILKNHLTPAFGHLRLDELTAEHIEKYKADKLSGDPENKIPPLKPKSINNHLIVLAKLLAVAVEWKKITDPPTVKLMKVEDHDFDFLDFEETKRLLDGAEAAWRTAILVALRAGLRIGEIIALRWDDVDLKARTVMVRHGSWMGIVGSPKGGKPKPIPLTAELVAALSELPSRFAGKLVFAQADGSPYSREMCHRPLWRACVKAGIRKVGWHVLRHSFGSHLAIREVPIKTIQELMRHASINMTMRYAHLTPDAREDAINRLDAGSGHGKLHGTIREQS